MTFKQFHKGLQLANVSADELLTKTDRRLNSKPPERLWPNIVKPAQVWDAVRDYYGKPFICHSTYRALPYNRSKKSSDGSRHVQFNAIDGHIRGVSHRVVANRILALRKAGMFKGGVGLYSWGVHVDTRGKNATWGF